MSDHCTIDQQQSLAQEIMNLSFDSSSSASSCLRPSSRGRRHRGQHQHRFALVKIALVATIISACLAFTTHAFSSSPSYSISSRRSSARSIDRRFYMSAVAEQPSSSMTDFQRRMRGLVKRNSNNSSDGARRRIGRGSSATRNNDQRPTNLKLVHTLEEYKEVLDEHKDKMVVVRFFATWCKACKAIQPSYYRMASLYPHIIFLEVPVTNDNVNLHQGLEVPSLPYGHIYYPNAGLVEEMKISKKYFHNLVKCVRWYDAGECELSEQPQLDQSEDDE